ncbi:uncharacterized protein LOC112351231 [Selaginella moellendorffii]|uniref:uncharacterized protein LOC112351231 n=1 Tax=Selaginella moellendorffii TaxID=88036 RepID=UPI000D1CB092|nr:uncharacterized protein LOC112351231 [Selaginella moellendorffii]|eukprot:XP_024544474.1 uncharacterized protein LOC112351231 [Selaginella moellendorffii]
MSARRPPEETISSSYIFKVHYLIERCLLLHMDQEETIEALAQANVDPAIAEIVWNELVKANTEFFAHYFRAREAKRSSSRPADSSSSRSSSPTPWSSSLSVPNFCKDQGCFSSDTSSEKLRKNRE